MTPQEYQLALMQLNRLKEKLHKRFVYRDAIIFTRTLLTVEKYEQDKRTREAEGFGGRNS